VKKTVIKRLTETGQSFYFPKLVIIGKTGQNFTRLGFAGLGCLSSAVKRNRWKRVIRHFWFQHKVAGDFVFIFRKIEGLSEEELRKYLTVAICQLAEIGSGKSKE